ncbi:MAG TPA: lysylphosphatidylglycerol synthase transmembrane domain-containing protein [Blastocatellia bacterium]|nr:lysylphosphatidylglycerol synthase transmembrane domain-containing protein [Blastocatellia bacterium]
MLTTRDRPSPALAAFADSGDGRADWIRPALGYLLAAAGLIWVLHDFQWDRWRGLTANLDWRWIAPAVACDLVSYLCQGARWRLLLKPRAQISTWRTTQAIYAGLFTNEILPMRLGEMVRAYLVSRWTAVRMIELIPSMVAERLFDGLWLAAGIGVTALAAPIPGELRSAAGMLGAGFVAAAATMFYLARRPLNPARSFRSRWPALSSWLERLSSGWRSLGEPRVCALSLIWSLAILTLQALAFWLVTIGCGLHLSIWIGVACFLITHLGTAIPNAPANVGAYQFFTVAGLTLFGVDKNAATVFSLIVFAVLTLPLLMLGFLALSRSGTSLAKIRREAQTPAP